MLKASQYARLHFTFTASLLLTPYPSFNMLTFTDCTLYYYSTAYPPFTAIPQSQVNHAF